MFLYYNPERVTEVGLCDGKNEPQQMYKNKGVMSLDRLQYHKCRRERLLQKKYTCKKKPELHTCSIYVPKVKKAPELLFQG
jgi:hypothetical protein